jgi:hypothetical protein
LSASRQKAEHFSISLIKPVQGAIIAQVLGGEVHGETETVTFNRGTPPPGSIVQLDGFNINPK